jgi:hypothetical protein
MERFTINACDVQSNRKVGKNRKVIPVCAIPLLFTPPFDGITILSQYANDELTKTGTIKYKDVDFTKLAPPGTITHMIQTENAEEEEKKEEERMKQNENLMME